MLHASDLKAMPIRHRFAKGDGEFLELHPTPVKWVAIKEQYDWAIYVAPIKYSFEDVIKMGKIVDIPKIIEQIMPCDSEAMALYRK